MGQKNVILTKTIVVCQNYSGPQTTSVKGVPNTKYSIKPIVKTLKDTPHHHWEYSQP